MRTDPAIPPAYAQNVFEWEMATNARPVYWIGPYKTELHDLLGPDRYVVWEAWSDGQAMVAWGLPLANAMQIVDALRFDNRPHRHRPEGAS